MVSATTATADSTTDDQLARLTEQIEIPYVPATQRQRTNIVDDSIVVVGQARQKKRKRAKASSAPDVDPEVTMDAESLAETSQTRGLKQRKGRNKDTDTNPQEPFDYSVVPNILDDVPTPESEGNSRKKKRNRNNGEHVPVYVVTYRPTAQAVVGQAEYWSTATFLHPPKLIGSLKAVTSRIHSSERLCEMGKMAHSAPS